MGSAQSIAPSYVCVAGARLWKPRRVIGFGFVVLGFYVPCVSASFCFSRDIVFTDIGFKSRSLIRKTSTSLQDPVKHFSKLKKEL